MTDSLMQERVTALAAIFQAAALVDELANSGSTAPRAFATSIDSLFALDAERVNDIYPSAAGLAMGREFLEGMLRRKTGADSRNRVGYVMAMMHLNGLLRANGAMQEIIHTRLGQIAADLRSPEDRVADDTVSRIAALYVDTFGSLGYRVQVKGDPRQLQSTQVAARIRASLFAGVRAAHLWHHLGGRRWQLLFGARRMLDAL